MYRGAHAGASQSRSCLHTDRLMLLGLPWSQAGWWYGALEGLVFAFSLNALFLGMNNF